MQNVLSFVQNGIKIKLSAAGQRMIFCPPPAVEICWHCYIIILHSLRATIVLIVRHKNNF